VDFVGKTIGYLIVFFFILWENLLTKLWGLKNRLLSCKTAFDSFHVAHTVVSLKHIGSAPHMKMQEKSCEKKLDGETW